MASLQLPRGLLPPVLDLSPGVMCGVTGTLGPHHAHSSLHLGVVWTQDSAPLYIEGSAEDPLPDGPGAGSFLFWSPFVPLAGLGFHHGALGHVVDVVCVSCLPVCKPPAIRSRPVCFLLYCFHVDSSARYRADVQQFKRPLKPSRWRFAASSPMYKIRIQNF